jgi:hypothetical protein
MSHATMKHLMSHHDRVKHIRTKTRISLELGSIFDASHFPSPAAGEWRRLCVPHRARSRPGKCLFVSSLTVSDERDRRARGRIPVARKPAQQTHPPLFFHPKQDKQRSSNETQRNLGISDVPHLCPLASAHPVPSSPSALTLGQIAHTTCISFLVSFLRLWVPLSPPLTKSKGRECAMFVDHSNPHTAPAHTSTCGSPPLRPRSPQPLHPTCHWRP